MSGSESNLLQLEVEVYDADQSECEDMFANCRVFKFQYKNTRNITVKIDFKFCIATSNMTLTIVLMFLF